jgi:ribosomal protein S18 acetylase RimI-like enzyme
MQNFISQYHGAYMTKMRNLRWDKMNTQTLEETTDFLKARESHCVAACSKFLSRNGGKDHVWSLREGGTISALLLHSGRTLFPVFDRSARRSASYSMTRFLRKIPIHAVQGRLEDTELLDHTLTSLGYECADWIDYDQMTLDGEPDPAALKAGPPGLVLRRPGISDMDALYSLQAAYEVEEVLPKGRVFNPAACRRSLERIIAGEYVLTAELDGRVIGKINTNALSFSRYQIGGVYVHPAYRGRGIAVSMGAAFARLLIAHGWGLSLFVKKRNSAARAVYRRIGFTVTGNYRISYY